MVREHIIEFHEHNIKHNLNNNFQNLFCYISSISAEKNETKSRRTLAFKYEIQAVRIFQRFRILTSMFNRAFDICIVAQMVLINILITVAAFGCIKYFGILNYGSYARLLISVVIGVVNSVIQTPQSGLINLKCETFRRIINHKIVLLVTESNRNPRRITIKYLKYLIVGCWDMKINLGGFYSYKMSTLITFFDIIVNNTITLLITFQSHHSKPEFIGDLF